MATTIHSARAASPPATGDSTSPSPQRLSQRELRNESGRVLREVSSGTSFILTNNGVAVGKLVPLDAPPAALTITRPARRKGGWSGLAIPRKKAGASIAELLDSMREDRL